MTELLLTPNPYSRPGMPMRDVKGIVLHWVAHPGSTARATRAYFESRKDGKLGYGSAHYAIDPGETVLMVPEAEVAYHCGAWKYTDYALDKFGTYPNAHTIGVELHHPLWDGHFHPDTLTRCRILLYDVCMRYKLDPIEDICRHYDIVATGKNCPKWFVDHPDDFVKFKNEIKEMM